MAQAGGTAVARAAWGAAGGGAAAPPARPAAAAAGCGRHRRDAAAARDRAKPACTRLHCAAAGAWPRSSTWAAGRQAEACSLRRASQRGGAQLGGGGGDAQWADGPCRFGGRSCRCFHGQLTGRLSPAALRSCWQRRPRPYRRGGGGATAAAAGAQASAAGPAAGAAGGCSAAARVGRRRRPALPFPCRRRAAQCTAAALSDVDAGLAAGAARCCSASAAGRFRLAVAGAARQGPQPGAPPQPQPRWALRQGAQPQPPPWAALAAAAGGAAAGACGHLSFLAQRGVGLAAHWVPGGLVGSRAKGRVARLTAHLLCPLPPCPSKQAAARAPREARPHPTAAADLCVGAAQLRRRAGAPARGGAPAHCTDRGHRRSRHAGSGAPAGCAMCSCCLACWPLLCSPRELRDSLCGQRPGVALPRCRANPGTHTLRRLLQC